MIDKQDYIATVTIDIDASVESVWAALTEPQLVKQYLHGANIATDWKVGNSITWHGIWEEKPYEDKGVVLEYEPYNILKYTHWSPLTGGEDKPENYHTITVKLSENNKSTRLTLAQSNNPSQEAADAMSKNGWLPMMESLKALVEK